MQKKGDAAHYLIIAEKHVLAAVAPLGDVAKQITENSSGKTWHRRDTTQQRSKG
jgi:hypothetical protein